MHAWGLAEVVFARCACTATQVPHLLMPPAEDMCVSDAAGKCAGAVITTPVRFPSCTVDVCVAIDGSGSIGNDWGAEVSIVRGLVAAVGGANSRLAVWLFSSSAQQMVAPTTFGAARASDAFTRTMVTTEPPYGGTNAAEAIAQCTVRLQGSCSNWQ